VRGSRHSYEEYDLEKVEKKSKEFLKRIMGSEKFEKLQKDGKIEIEVDNKLSIDNVGDKKTIYELYSDGRVINKTKHQSYCIVTERSDYPLNDMIAIKYAWLVHENDIAEKVANKTNLRTRVVNRPDGAPVPIAYGDFVRDMEQRGWNRQQVRIDGVPWYGDYVDYMMTNSWHREVVTLDQNNTNIVKTCGVRKDATSAVVDVRCPAGMKLSIMGRRQVPSDADVRMAYSLGLYITDENGEEIPGYTKVRIVKDKPSESIIQLVRAFY